MDTSTKVMPFNVLSLCSGAGGLDLGIRLAVPEARTICYIEREIPACEILAARMQDQVIHEAPIWTDIKTFDGKPWRGIVHCIAAGYPCQPFSIMGQKSGENDPRHLWPEVARILGETDADFIFIENVPNHINIGFDRVRDQLREMGYALEAGLFSTSEVGGPHVRQRLFALGHSKSRPIQLPELRQSRTIPIGGRYCGLDEKCLQEKPFPPTPENWGEWEKLLGKADNRKPAFFDVDDELAAGLDESTSSRIKQFRILGNGVVPACAAYAFSILYERLERSRK